MSLSISNATPNASTATGPGVAGQIQRLQQQIQQTQQKIKNLYSNSDMDAKSKQRLSMLLHMHIQMLQAQIQALQRQRGLQAQGAALRQQAADDAGAKQAQPGSVRRLDLYA